MKKERTFENCGIDPQKISDFLLIECREWGEVLTNLKLQKLLYYSQAWYLADHNTSLFDEDFQAWIHGPVLLSQYQRFKSCEWKPILSDISKPNLGEKIEDHLTNIVDFFGKESAIALEITTKNELPWQEARKGVLHDEPSKEKIKKSSMQNFYINL